MNSTPGGPRLLGARVVHCNHRGGASRLATKTTCLIIALMGSAASMAAESTDPALAKIHQKMAASCRQTNDEIAQGKLSNTNGGDLQIALCVYAKMTASLEGWDSAGHAECAKALASLAAEFKRRFPDTPVTAAARAC